MPRPHADLAGRRFGRFTAICRVEIVETRDAVWLCLCDCGAFRCVRSCNLTGGDTRSCGCTRRDQRGIKSSRKNLERARQARWRHKVKLTPRRAAE